MKPLSPYAKTVVAAVGGVVAVVYQLLLGNPVDYETLGTAVIALLTTLGVYQATNSVASQGATEDPNAPSPAEITVNALQARAAANGAKVRAAKTGVQPRPRKKTGKK
jgi:hypothetical protein